MRKINNITYWIIILPIIAVLLTSTILTYEFISYENKEFQEEIEHTQKRHIEEIKERIKNRVNRTIKLIETQSKLQTLEEKNNIKNIVNIGYKTIKQIYLQNESLTKEEILEKVVKSLDPQRFYSNASGYYFIIDLNDKVIMQPQTPSHVGLTLSDLQDKEGKYFIQEFNKIVKEKKEGFTTWYWDKPHTNKISKKLGYVKLFEPLGIYIGTARYVEDIDKKIEHQILRIIDTIKYDKNEYLFVMNEKGTTLSHINKSFVGKKLETLSSIEQNVVKNILEKGSVEGGSFLGYTPTSHNVSKELSKKISFVKKVPKFNWVIGTGQYTTKIEEQFLKKKADLEKEVEDAKNKIIVISTIISLLLIVILVFIAKRIDSQFRRYEKELKKNNEELKSLNESLETKVKEQVLKIRKTDELLNQQSRLASMGEMIGNIAHQWRQPLSTISTIASGIKLEDELNLMTKDKMYKNLDLIVSNTKHLSDTIEDFRNFFKKDKTKTNFILKNIIEKVINLMSASLKNKDIKIKLDIDENIELYTLENELTQAILNILNNSKDALLEKELACKIIKIKAYKKEEKIYIEVYDNGGGISESIIDKIFEPYFTTKFQSQGTGIGLYMTRTIIVGHMKGKIQAMNTNLECDGKDYKAALIQIVIDE
ncbi:sensor histidine kinase [Arcobacter sp. YIC-464]|uniref:sensor histidine kinase n=1 Tax=Arcobacter sp. YIC-464 TaxID=3376631 RepID=UPI003C139900